MYSPAGGKAWLPLRSEHSNRSISNLQATDASSRPIYLLADRQSASPFPVGASCTGDFDHMSSVQLANLHSCGTPTQVTAVKKHVDRKGRQYRTKVKIDPITTAKANVNFSAGTPRGAASKCSEGNKETGYFTATSLPTVASHDAVGESKSRFR